MKKNRKYEIIKEDNKLKQFMLGSMLGDGSIAKLGKNSRQYRMTLGHSEKQLSYLKWKVDLLKEYKLSTGTITKVVSKSIRYKTGECISYHTKSRTNPYFESYRKEFYTTKKVVSDLVKNIDSFGLAIWFMDDGWLSFDKIRNRKIYWLSTDSFNKSDLDKLIIIMKDNFDLTFTINYGKILRLSEKDNDKFKSLIINHILPNFNYKLH